MSEEDFAQAIVLDVLAHGRSDDDRPGYQREPVCYAITAADFQLYELTFEGQPPVSIGDFIEIEPLDAIEGVVDRATIGYDGLSSGAKSELEYVVEEIIERNEQHFVDFFTEAQPVSLRLHQLNLLPGIGDKIRDGILDARKRGPFSSFDDLEARVDGLHDPKSVLTDRILDELREADMKYYLFVGSDALWVQQ